MNRTYLARSWINEKLVSGKSTIHGDGVCTTAPIAAGEKLMEFGGSQVTRDEAYSNAYWSRSVWQADEQSFLARPKSDTVDSLDEHLNHSCDANAWLTDEVTLVAKRDIAKGEEIPCDQGTWNFDDEAYTDDQAPCSCGAADCRHTLTKDDWKLPLVQEKYKGHFHPLVQEMIDAKS